MKTFSALSVLLFFSSFLYSQDSIGYRDFNNFRYEIENKPETEIVNFLDQHLFTSSQKNDQYFMKDLVKMSYFTAIKNAFAKGFRTDILDAPFDIQFSCGVGYRRKKSSKSYNTCYEVKKYTYLEVEKTILAKINKLIALGATLKIDDVKYASSLGYKECLKTLLTLTSDPKMLSCALYEASYNGYIDLVTYLVEDKNADPTIVHSGYSPLWAGIKYFEISKYYVSKGYKLDLTLSNNSNMIQQAARYGCPATVKLVLQFGPDVKIKNSWGDNAFSLCKESKSEDKDEVLLLLKEYNKKQKKG